MRTVSTLCASGAGIGIASVGLALIREENQLQTPREPSPSNAAMTAVAAYPHANITSPFNLAAANPESGRAISEGRNGKARPSTAIAGQKRSLTPSASFKMKAGRQSEREDESNSRTGTPSPQPHAWLKRFSSTVSTSRDSSQPSMSRPGSAAVSQSNGSLAFSHATSTTPMFPDDTPTSLPPNKLVKRSSSLRSSNGSPFQNSGSRLPIPVFRRPPTSHDRSAALQERYSGTDQSDHMSIDGKSSETRDPPRQYFTPRIRSDDWYSARRRNSSSIPTPIRRVYPDRKYKPFLVSASSPIRPAQMELDDGQSSDDEGAAATMHRLEPSSASSPLPLQTVQFEEGQTPKRAFSIGDLLSTGPQPLWRRPSSSRGKASGSKLVRRGRQRVVSAPQTAMGNAFSAGESERPAKRRDITDPQAAARSIYSSASSNPTTDPEPNYEIQLHMSATTPRSEPFNHDSARTEARINAQGSSPAGQHTLPSATVYSEAARPVRLSAARSEIVSTVGSDSNGSIGDASTDYQSDAVYDSYPTRTTRSSSGRRGPHIGTFFDDSPPQFSSGSSTRLKDFLNDGAEQGQRYRHSTIEEEGSIASTPVRSLRDNSVTSTPSARPGAQQHFMSSPPIMPDPDDIDWDALEDEDMESGKGTERPSPMAFNQSRQAGPPFRFGPALRQPYSASADGTPSRQNGSNPERTNLFEWSEAQPSPSHNNSPPRPRTVHGKKDPESRGSRPPGRRPPSGMHARSHSVPVVPDVDGNRTHVVANKFGTWGVGSKAVTEDWDDAFDFDELPMPLPESIIADERRIDSGHEVFVPRSIREQQKVVVANIELLREWCLLIEELKELRIRAVSLDMLNGSYARDWQEVDAMIEFADQETDEPTLEPRRSPPSSPGFDYGAFEDTVTRQNLASSTRSREQSLTLPEPAVPAPSIASSRAGPQPATPKASTTSRPRKDSEAVARSVIEALHSKRSISDPIVTKPATHPTKVPFDTNTLRHIVPYVKELKRRVKEGLRETEGLYSSPRRRNSTTRYSRFRDEDDDENEPAFRSIFNDPQSNRMPMRQRSRRDQAHTDHDGSEVPSRDRLSDLARRMQTMNLPK